MAPPKRGRLTMQSPGAAIGPVETLQETRPSRVAATPGRLQRTSRVLVFERTLGANEVVGTLDCCSLVAVGRLPVELRPCAFLTRCLISSGAPCCIFELLALGDHLCTRGLQLLSFDPFYAPREQRCPAEPSRIGVVTAALRLG